MSQRGAITPALLARVAMRGATVADPDSTPNATLAQSDRASRALRTAERRSNLDEEAPVSGWKIGNRIRHPGVGSPRADRRAHSHAGSGAHPGVAAGDPRRRAAPGRRPDAGCVRQ